MKIVILSRQLNQLPGLVHRRLPRPERQADGRVRGIEPLQLIRGRFLRPRDHMAVLVDLLVAERKRVVDGHVRETEEDAPMMSSRKWRATRRCRRSHRACSGNTGGEYGA